MNTQHENTIHFMTGEDSKCVMRIEANRIWVDPEVEVTEAAALVLQALESNIKRLVEAEREACAKVCDDMGKTMADRDGEITEWCAAAIRERGEKWRIE